MRAGANDLLKFAAKKLPLVPAEFGATDRGAGLALGLARVAALMGRKDQAAALFTSVQSGRIKGTTAIQTSFAALGVARAYVAKDDLGHAKEAYLASLKANERAAFRDATLRELALLIERQAAGAQTAGVPPSGGNGGNAPPKGGTPTAAAKTPTLQETLPYWQKLATQFPSSPYAAEALDHAANLQLAADQWKPAAENLEKLVKDFPTSPWAGDASRCAHRYPARTAFGLGMGADLRRRRREMVRNESFGTL